MICVAVSRMSVLIISKVLFIVVYWTLRSNHRPNKKDSAMCCTDVVSFFIFVFVTKEEIDASRKLL